MSPQEREAGLRRQAEAFLREHWVRHHAHHGGRMVRELRARARRRETQRRLRGLARNWQG